MRRENKDEGKDSDDIESGRDLPLAPRPKGARIKRWADVYLLFADPNLNPRRHGTVQGVGEWAAGDVFLVAAAWGIDPVRIASCRACLLTAFVERRAQREMVSAISQGSSTRAHFKQSMDRVHAMELQQHVLTSLSHLSPGAETEKLPT
jgi:hypothetical protein